jgi:hypothetical protein
LWCLWRVPLGFIRVSGHPCETWANRLRPPRRFQDFFLDKKFVGIM